MLSRRLPLLGLVLFCGLMMAPQQLRAQNAAAPRSITLETTRSAKHDFSLVGRETWQQVVVTGRYAGDELRDLTRAATYQTTPSGIIAVDATGLVTPLKDGEATLSASMPGGLTSSVKITVAQQESDHAIHFENQIVPIFTRFGCNGGGCHGKSGGQNGFSLSLLGFEPQEDYEYIVKENRGRRLFPAAPEQSLLLTKATGRSPHGGGKRLDPDAAYYRLLLRWVAQGAPRGKKDDPVVTRIEVHPIHRILAREAKQQLTVIAHLSDGSTEDVTRLAQFEANHANLAEVSGTGLVTVKSVPGSVAVMARFQTHVAVFQALIPLGESIAKMPASRNFIDGLVFDQLKRLGVPPSEPCSEATFLRRVTLDLAGRLPTLEETKSYLAEGSPDKSEKLVDRLLASEDFAFYFANKWGAILRNRRSNPNDDLKPNVAFHAWIKDGLHQNKPFDQFVRELITVTGEDIKDPPVVWYREVKDPAAQVEDLAQLFLGQRIACAKCHHHPFEKWTQDDYWGMTAFFSQLDIKVAAPDKKNKDKTRVPSTVAHKPGTAARAVNPRTKLALKPAGLGSSPVEVNKDDDPRIALAAWMTAPENPFFARTLANRTWKHFFGRGLVEPEDDLRMTNPPSNPALLDGLTKHVVESKFDFKAIIRSICNSQVYRLSAIPNAHNAEDTQNFSHFYLRRMNAEVLLDAIDTVAGSKSRFKGLPEGTLAVQLPDNQFQSYFLSIFGRPDSASPCECERSSGANLGQSLYLSNSDDLLEKIRGRVKVPEKPVDPKAKPSKKAPQGLEPSVTTTNPGGRIQQILKDKRPDEEKIRDIYLVALSREPSSDELRVMLAYVEARPMELATAYEDILWAVINTKEFLFNH